MISDVKQLMVKRIMIFRILVSSLQVVVYLLIFILWNVEKIFHTPKDSDIITGFAVIMSIILFGFIIFIQKFLIEIFNKNVFTASMFFIVIFIYTFGWGQDIFSFPFKTFIFLIAGIASLTIKFLIDINFKNLKFKIVNHKSEI